MARKRNEEQDAGESGMGATVRTKLNVQQISERALELARLGQTRDEHVAKYKVVQSGYRTKLKQIDLKRAKLQREVNDGHEEVSAQEQLFEG